VAWLASVLIVREVVSACDWGEDERHGATTIPDGAVSARGKLGTERVLGFAVTDDGSGDATDFNLVHVLPGVDNGRPCPLDILGFFISLPASRSLKGSLDRGRAELVLFFRRKG
jgi:hypothetical protein